MYGVLSPPHVAVLVDVAIVRQLMENFIDAAGQARDLLDRAGHGAGAKAEARLPSQQLTWTGEDYSRLYNAPGTLDAHRDSSLSSTMHILGISLWGRSSFRILDRSGSGGGKRARAQTVAFTVG